MRAVETIGRTKGRPVYSHVRMLDGWGPVNYETGFLVGWEHWSDGRITELVRWPDVFVDRTARMHGCTLTNSVRWPLSSQ